jgi:hypothetical protein
MINVFRHVLKRKVFFVCKLKSRKIVLESRLSLRRFVLENRYGLRRNVVFLYWYSLRRRVVSESRHVFISITAGTIHSFKLVFYYFVVVKAKV